LEFLKIIDDHILKFPRFLMLFKEYYIARQTSICIIRNLIFPVNCLADSFIENIDVPNSKFE